MRYFFGTYERSPDDKGRLLIPSQFRSVILADKRVPRLEDQSAEVDDEDDGKKSGTEGARLFVTLGARPRTLSLYTAKRWHALLARLEPVFEADDEGKQFELQFLSTAVEVDMDKQGRLILPDRLRRKAKLEKDLVLVGQKHRIDLWKKADYEQSLGIDWAGDEWPDWRKYMQRRPASPT
jgi:MraZ protein